MAYIGRQPTAAALTSSDITDGIITTAKIAADAVTDAKIADDVVGTEHLTAGEVDATALGADAVTLAKMAAGTDGNIISYDASGDPVAIATGTSGHFLKSAGAGSPPAFAAAGIANADMWRIHTTLTGLSYPGGWVTANWERADSRGQGTGMQIGTGVTESSGTFTFPQTGIWKIDSFFTIAATNFNTPYIQVQTQLSDDGTNFQAASRVGQGLTTYDSVTDIHGAHASSVLFNVDNTTNCKVQFYFRVAGVQASIIGVSTEGHNGVVFYRLGDT